MPTAPKQNNRLRERPLPRSRSRVLALLRSQRQDAGLGQCAACQRRVELPLSPTDAVPLGLAVASEEHLLHRIAKRRRHACGGISLRAAPSARSPRARASQSNFCRLAAAAARRLSLGVVLVLAGESGGGRTGNLTLDALFGAEVRWAGAADHGRLEAAAREVAAELRERGERPALLPFGGSSAVSARGYVAAAEEISEQEGEFERVVVAVFLHTGGLPGLFGHLIAAEIAAAADHFRR